LEERLWVVEPEADLEQHLARRDPTRTPPCFADVETDLLVARTTKSLLFGMFADRAADVCGPIGSEREPVDLVEEPDRDARREEAHEPYGAGETVTRVSRLRAETVS
jgi:hypothetical protein